MIERWLPELEEILGKKRCSVCGEELEIGDDFLLKERKYFHPECYFKEKAENFEDREEKGVSVGSIKKKQDDLDIESKSDSFSTTHDN